MKSLWLPIIVALSVAGIGKADRQASGQTEAWTRYTPEKCGLSLELPGEPQQEAIAPPEEVRAVINYMNLYLYAGSEMIVVISHTGATMHLPAKSMAEGVIKGIISTAGSSDLNYSTEPSTDTKAPIKGTYKQSGIVVELNGIALSQEKQSWVVVVGYPQTIPASKTAAQRVLSSIKIDGKPCPGQKEVVGQNRVPVPVWLRPTPYAAEPAKPVFMVF